MEQDGEGITLIHKDFNFESMAAISKHKDNQNIVMVRLINAQIKSIE